MPPFSADSLLHSVSGQNLTATNGTTPPPAVQVICAWPVSGQYGFGTRLVYYGLVATCVLARRKEGLKNACLAGALLLPSVAAIHAVVLAAVHVDSAVDMDIYGAFQICSIGILAAPLTVYNSRTYFNDPGRNLIFLWTGLLLAGMVSLAIEFYRANAHPCLLDDRGIHIDPFNLTAFPYSEASCNLNCFYNHPGPFSPIRRDSTNSPAVIPAPSIIPFGAAALLAAGSSIPPVLTLIFTWEKILEINWRRRFAQEESEENETIDGTNGATPKMITGINGIIRVFLGTLQIPIFTGIVIAILVSGEVNFWSPQVRYQTEPFSSIGQWANVVATILVVPGSIFYVQKEKRANEKEYASSTHSRDPMPRPSMESNITDHESVNSRATGAPDGKAPGTSIYYHDTSRGEHVDGQSAEHIEMQSVSHHRTHETITHAFIDKRRNKIATRLKQISEYLGTPAADRYDNSEFRRMQGEFPEIPGEAGRVPNLPEIRDIYRKHRHIEGGTSIGPGLTRVNSFQSSISHSDSGSTNRRRSLTPSRSPPRESHTATTSQVRDQSQRRRRDTLAVPGRPMPVHINPRPRNSSSPCASSRAMVIDTIGSPTIVISADPEEASSSTSTSDSSSSPS